MTTALYQAAAAGAFAAVDGALERLLGRSPTPLADVLRRTRGRQTPTTRN